MSNKTIPLKELHLDEIEEEIKNVSPELLTHLKNMSMTKKHTFVKVEYNYGDVILEEDGVLNIRVGDRLLPINHPELPEGFKERFSYQSIPIGIILNDSSAEVYREINGQVFTLAILERGLGPGLYEKFASATSFSVSAGGRIFMLPKISDAQLHGQLKKKFDIRTASPKSLFDQSKLFKEMAQSPKFKQPWSCTILFFSKEWFDFKEAGDLVFEHFLLKKAWEQSEYARDTAIFELSWHQFWKHLVAKGMKPNPYLIQTVRQLTFIAKGVLPAFLPAGEKQTVAPTKEIQTIYLEDYKLKNYIPTVMQMGHFSADNPNQQPVYYSLQYPTLISDIPNYKGYVSVADEIRELKELMDIFIELVLNNEIKLDNVALKNLFSKVRYDFFHTDMHTYGDIRSTEEMPLEDKNLIYQLDKKGKRLFCSRNSFLRGCVRISIS